MPERHGRSDFASVNRHPARGHATFVSRTPKPAQAVNPSPPHKTFKDFNQPRKMLAHPPAGAQSTDGFIKPKDVKHSAPVKHHQPALPRTEKSQVLNRLTFDPKSGPNRKSRSRRRNYASKALMGMAGLLFLLGIGVSLHSLRTNRQATAQVAVLAKTTSGASDNEVPDETPLPPDATKTYRVAADLPRLLRIPKIHVEARVKRLGTKANNELKAPASVYDVGWYEGSSKPGENGTVLLDGHVSGPNNRGVFYSLNTLKTNDKLSIERGDGKVLTYIVVKSEIYARDKVDMAAALTSAVPGKSGLNIITCSGKYDARTNNYDERLVVFAVQI